MTAERYVIVRRVAAKVDGFQDRSLVRDAGLRLEVKGAALQPADLRDLRRDKDVFGMAPVFPMRLHEPRARRNGPGRPPRASWGLKAVGAANCPYDGAGVTVAILDSGIQLDHPAFAAIRDRIVVRDFTGEGDGDTDGHGTHCAGTIFGGQVEGTRIGVAPGIQKALVGKVIGANGGSTESVIEAIEWVIREGAQIVSMSLGLDFPGCQAAYVRRGEPAELAISRALEAYRANVRLFESLVNFQTTAAASRQAALLFRRCKRQREPPGRTRRLLYRRGAPRRGGGRARRGGH